MVARNAMKKGLSADYIHEITGLDIELIKTLKAEILDSRTV